MFFFKKVWIEDFLYNVIWLCPSILPVPPRSPSLPHPPNFVLLSYHPQRKQKADRNKKHLHRTQIHKNGNQINKKKNPVRQNKNNNKTKQSELRQKAYRNTAEFLLCWPSTPRQRACPEVSLIYPERLHWRKLIFLFAGGCQLQIVSWLEVEIHVHFPALVLGPCLAFTPMYALCLRPQSPKFLFIPVSGRYLFLIRHLTNNYVGF